MKKRQIIVMLSLFFGLLLIMLSGDNDFLPFLVPLVFAHCDTMDGPVIKDAKKSLETGNVNLVLIWVQKKDEAEIRKAFEKTLSVRKLNPEAKELADMYFFETLVRIHRAGEGAPYTGIKPAGTDVGAAVVAADKAVETGSVENLAREVSKYAAEQIRERFNHVMEKKEHANESIEAGREYVEAYVTFVHYVEGLHLAASGEAPHHPEMEGEGDGGEHKHQ